VAIGLRWGAASRCAVSLWALPAFVLLLQVYGQGSGRDCRLHVQKLNLLQGEAEEAAARTAR